MLGTMIFLLGATQALSAPGSNFSFARMKLQARLAGSSSAGNVPGWLAVLADANNAYVGAGVIINSYWFVVNYHAVKTLTPETIKTHFVYTNMLRTNDPAGEGVVRREGKHLKFHPDATSSSFTNALALVKACPSFSSALFAPLPLATDAFAPYVSAMVYAYHSPNLVQMTKRFGEECECEFIYPGLDPDHQECLEATMSNYAVPGDLNGCIVVSNNKVVGLLVAEQRKGSGEIVLNLSTYKSSWIDVAAV